MPSLLLLGAHSDIGRACAHRFAAAGFDLLLTTRRVASNDKDFIAQLSEQYQVQVQRLHFDARDHAVHEQFHQELPYTPDVVVAAIGYLGDAQLARTNAEESSRILNANYTGLVPTLDRLAQGMQKRGSGHILGISSVAGERGRSSNYHYGSAKAGFTAYLSGLRQAFRPHGVYVTTVIPGFVRTKMLKDQPTPSLLTAQPKQVAEAVYRAMQNRRAVVYCLPIWRLIMWIIRHLPESIFQRLSL